MDQSIQQFAKRVNELSIEGGCLLWGIRVIIPEELRKTVLAQIREGHLGTSKMKALARSYVWWPNLDRDIEDLARSCEQCQNQKSRPSTTKPHIHGSTQHHHGNVSMQILQNLRGSSIYLL